MADEIWNEKHWSMSVATLQRIDSQLRNINQIKLTPYQIDLPLLTTVLDILYDEIYPFLNKKEHKETARELKNKMAEEYSNYSGKGIRRMGSGLELYHACNALNLFLREMLYEHDLLMNRPEDTSHLF